MSGKKGESAKDINKSTQGHQDEIKAMRSEMKAVKKVLAGHEKISSNLKETRELFDTFTSNMLDGLVVIDWDGNILFANKAAYQIVGLKPRRSPRGLNMAQFLHPEDLQKALEIHMLAKTGKVGSLTQYRIITPKHDQTWIEAIGRRVPFGGQDASLVTFRDITDQKSEEKALKESEERFRALHEASFGGIGIHDKGIILDCNHGLVDITGYSMDELIGMNGLDLIAPKWRDLVLQNIVTGYEKSYDVEGVRKDGTTYPLEIIGKNIPYHGRTVRVTEFRDLSRRKQDQEALHESEDRYRKIVAAITDYIYTVHVEGGRAVYTEHSPACEAVTGYRVEEFNTDPYLWFNMVVEEDRERVREYFNQVLMDNHAGPIEHRIFHKDGSVRWVANMPVVHRDEAGAIIFYDGVLSDITERKNAEEAIRQRQAKLDSIFRAAPTGIGVVADRILLEVNDRICEMTGYSREELVGKTARIFYPTQEDFDYVGTEKYCQIQDKGTGTVETHWKQKDGTIIDILLSSTPIVPGDLLAGVTFTALDITERKQAEEALKESEERYRLMAELTGKLVYDYDVPTGRITWHGAISQLTGYSPEEFGAVDIKAFNEMIQPEDRTEVVVILEAALKECGPYNAEYRLLRKDGTYIFVEDHGVFLPDDKGRAVRMLGILGDISVRKQADADIHEAEKRYRTLFESANDAIFIMSEDRFIECNHMTLNMFGCDSKDDIFGHRPWEFSPIEQPDGRASIEKAQELINTAFEGTPQHFYWKHVHKDGTPFDAEVTLNRIELGDQPYLQALVRDITKRMKAEEALRESEERYHSLFEDSHAVMLLIHPNTGQIVDANPAACVYYGYTKQELTTKNIFEINTFTQEQILTEMQRAKEHEQHSFFFKHRLSNGDIRDVEVFSGPIKISGQPLLYSIVHDTTERKKAEAALQESEERFRGIAVNLPGGVFQFFARPEGEMGLNYVSEKALELLGLSNDPHDFFPHLTACIAPEDRDSFLSSINEAVNSVGRWDFEARYIKSTGEEMYFRGISEPMETEDGLVFNGVILDITERKRAEKALKESEERFRALIQSSLDIIVIMDENGLITYESPSLERVLKYPPGSMIGKNPLDLMHPDDVATVARDLAEVFENVNAGFPTEFRFKRADGAWVYLEAIGNNLIDYPGINGVVITARDITERNKAEEERIDMERRLLHAQKLESLGVMAGGIAHDFNNLLMAILGNLDLARLDLSPVSRSRPFIDQALKAGRRAADLTNQMLAYSGKGRFDLKPFDLSELVQEMAHLLKASSSKTVTLNLQMEGNLPSIVADPSQIQQIIMNLIVNASEAVGEHPGVVTITTGAFECDQGYLQDSRLKEKPNPGAYVFFEVRDTGCGMDDETKDRLFDPFFTTKFTGRGLGMAAVLGIVSGHKGAIMVESELGEGTTIRVMFPASDGKRTLKGTKSGVPPVEIESVAAAPASGMILIADDEDMVRDLCRSMVERLGYKVITAKDGEEAVKIFHEHADGIVCVILDLTMPKLDGLAAYDELRRIKPDVKVIISSGYDERETTDRFAGKGLAGFIKKPYQLSSLDTELTRVLKDL
jgi:PAS domain S-box-containing protein